MHHLPLYTPCCFYVSIKSTHIEPKMQHFHTFYLIPKSEPLFQQLISVFCPEARWFANESFCSNPLLVIGSAVLTLAYLLFGGMGVITCFTNAPGSRETPDIKDVSFLTLLLWLLLGVFGVKMLLELGETLGFCVESSSDMSLST